VDEKAAKQIVDDFLCWSGGFAPEALDDIELFVRYARDETTDEHQVRDLLLEWLRAELDGRPWPYLSDEQDDGESTG